MNADTYAFTGQFVGTFTREYSAVREGRRCTIVTTYELIDIGRPDRTERGDPDAMINIAEELADAFGDHQRMTAALEAWKQQRRERDAQLATDLEAHFAEHGAQSVKQISQFVDSDKNRILRVLRENPDKFVNLGGPLHSWGLHGQKLGTVRTKKTTKRMLAILACLRANGPSTSADIARRLRADPSVIHRSVKARPDWFVEVGIRPGKGNQPDARVWGLTEEGRAGG